MRERDERPKIFVAASSPECWKAGLAQPEKQWKTGKSAKTLASCWQAANDFPLSVRRVFEESSEKPLHDLEMLLAIPEWKVPLPGGRHASQNDVFVLARATNGLVVIMVEGKVDEPFDQPVQEWLRTERGNRKNESDTHQAGVEPSQGKSDRLDYLCQLLGLSRSGVLDLRYQLLHRTASALIEAKRFTAPLALTLVHSFSPTALWLEDYKAFAAALGAQAEKDAITHVGTRNGIELYLGWCSGEQTWRDEIAEQG
ncbi:MAG: hypothetical protein ABSC51_06395 [Gaiellaceae bacterium]|jgi:hypothetical protein